MAAREKFSLLLILLGLILAILPLRATRTLNGDPGKLLAGSIDPGFSYTPDQVARFISDEDPDVRLIDLRSPEEFMKSSLPGSVNIPYRELLSKDPSSYLGSGKYRNIFYSNGDLVSGYAAILAAGLGYKNVYTVKGGLNGWIKAVSDTIFTGEKISARENALFGARMKAGRLFRELNALPDSLKLKYLNSRKFNPKKLDGGCE